jgi:excisionase family DNA binding protein
MALGRPAFIGMSLLKPKQPQGALMNIPSLYTPKQVADHLHVSRGTIYSMISRKEIQSLKVGRNRRFTSEHIEDYIRNRQTVVIVDV